MALNSPDLDVLGLTTVGGNASLADTTRNALALAEWLGHPELPVSRGAFRPVRGTFSYAYHYTVRADSLCGCRVPLARSCPCARPTTWPTWPTPTQGSW